MSVWVLVICWVYFFTLKRFKVLKIKKAEEILGQDAIRAAHSKGIHIGQLLEAITKKYPDSKKKGC
jgi:hypothetical protein